jgi:hypothetical protein
MHRSASNARLRRLARHLRPAHLKPLASRGTPVRAGELRPASAVSKQAYWQCARHPRPGGACGGHTHRQTLRGQTRGLNRKPSKARSKQASAPDRRRTNDPPRPTARIPRVLLQQASAPRCRDRRRQRDGERLRDRADGPSSLNRTCRSASASTGTGCRCRGSRASGPRR